MSKPNNYAGTAVRTIRVEPELWARAKATAEALGYAGGVSEMVREFLQDRTRGHEAA